MVTKYVNGLLRKDFQHCSLLDQSQSGLQCQKMAESMYRENHQHGDNAQITYIQEMAG